MSESVAGSPPVGPRDLADWLLARGRRDRPHGPVGDRLWDLLTDHAPVLRSTLGRVPTAKAAPARQHSSRRS